MKDIFKEIPKSLCRFDFVRRAGYTKGESNNKGPSKQLPLQPLHVKKARKIQLERGRDLLDTL